jgi:hypothetical protein
LTWVEGWVRRVWRRRRRWRGWRRRRHRRWLRRLRHDLTHGARHQHRQHEHGGDSAAHAGCGFEWAAAGAPAGGLRSQARGSGSQDRPSLSGPARAPWPLIRGAAPDGPRGALAGRAGGTDAAPTRGSGRHRHHSPRRTRRPLGHGRGRPREN